MGESKVGGCLGMSPSRFNLFNFHAVFDKTLPNDWLAPSCNGVGGLPSGKSRVISEMDKGNPSLCS